MPKPIIWGVIPARYGSTRFPGKPLASFLGRPMIEWVYKRCVKYGQFDRVVVATDDQRIYDHIKKLGGNDAMTSPHHSTGTERVAEVISKEQVDFVVNIQGDEPVIPKEYFQSIHTLLTTSDSDIATLALPITSSNELFSPNAVKVVTNIHHRAIYFSRSPIPYCRDIDQANWIKQGIYMRHIGVYGFKASILKELIELPVTSLEKFEKLEQLRWLEHGYEISVSSVTEVSHGIDTPEDLVVLEELVQNGTVDIE